MSEMIKAYEDKYSVKFDDAPPHVKIMWQDAWQASLQRSAEPVVFTCHGNNAPAYGCNKPGDMSGTYYKAPQPPTTKPIAAVKGWFHGECVIQALDPEAVLPAGMALYASPQPVGLTELGAAYHFVGSAKEHAAPADKVFLALHQKLLGNLIAEIESRTIPQPVIDEGYVLVPRAAVTEVLRISDRQHPAWEEVRTALLSADKETNK